jgi:hypothetical protein
MKPRWNLNKLLKDIKYIFYNKHKWRLMMTENKLEPKENFYIKIQKYYAELAGELIPNDLIKELCNKITNTQYNNYERFWKKYPKSRKRYSVLKMTDLEHPATHHEIIDFLKRNDEINYRKFSKMLKMSDKEFDDCEVWKHQYENK